MIRIDPASTDFERLPRNEQAKILRYQFGWNVHALVEEFGVSRSAIRRWTLPGAVEREREVKAIYFKTEEGRAKRREYVARYRAKMKALAMQEGA